MREAATMMPIGGVLGAVVFAGVTAAVLVAGLAFGAAALLFTAVAELLLEAHEIKESAGTIAMAVNELVAAYDAQSTGETRMKSPSGSAITKVRLDTSS